MSWTHCLWQTQKVAMKNSNIFTIIKADVTLTVSSIETTLTLYFHKKEIMSKIIFIKYFLLLAHQSEKRTEEINIVIFPGILLS